MTGTLPGLRQLHGAVQGREPSVKGEAKVTEGGHVLDWSATVGKRGDGQVTPTAFAAAKGDNLGFGGIDREASEGTELV